MKKPFFQLRSLFINPVTSAKAKDRFLMISTVRKLCLLLTFLCLLVPYGSVKASFIYKYWYLEGYQASGDAQNIGPVQRVTGGAQISGTGIQISTNGGSPNVVAPWIFDGVAYNYYHMETRPDEETGETIYVRSTRSRISVVDDDTLLFVHGVANYGGAQGAFSSYSWTAAVLTSSPVPIRSQAFTSQPDLGGKYFAVLSEMDENNYREGIEFTGRERNIDLFRRGAGGYDLRDGVDILFLPEGNGYGILRAGEEDTGRYERWTKDDFDSDGNNVGMFTAYNINQTNSVEIIALGDGRLFYIESESTLVDSIYLSFEDNSETYIEPFVADSQIQCALLTPSPVVFSRIAELSQVANPEAGIDPLQPRPETDMLGRLPVFAGGLVADGVTPWIIKLVGAAPGSNLDISFEPLQGGTLLNRSLAQRLRVLNGSTWQQATTAPVSASGECFAYLQGINPAEMSLAAGSNELTVTVRVQGGGIVGTSSFKIRKPPVVLVHGYNTDGIWGDAFYGSLTQDRPAEFVIPIQYGVDLVYDPPDPRENTVSSLFECSLLLTDELSREIENPVSGLRKDWAFSRYDAVGHSQGGVLLRMLSSRQANVAVPAFKNPANFNRGRFRSIVTIGSPHNGSRFLRYLRKMNERGILFSIAPSMLARKGILQNKFDPWDDEIKDLNDPWGRWIPDDEARFFMIRTTINDGNPPRLFSPILAYAAVGLNIYGGSTVLPRGSDGVVDLDSQGYAGSSNNVFDMPNRFVSHAEPLYAFGALQNQVREYSVAVKARAALNDEVTFGSFEVPQLLHETIRDRIDAVVLTHVKIDHAILRTDLDPSPAPSPAPSPSDPQPAPQDPENGVYSLTLVPPAGKEVEGDVDWTLEVFGPNGVDNVGVTLTVDPLDSRRVTVSVDAGVIGDVWLYARYGLSGGGVAFVSPLKVVSITPPGVNLTSIEMDPSVASLPLGKNLVVNLWANYSNGSRLLVYPDPSTVAFSSLSPAMAEVSDQGSVALKALGTATIQASYQGQVAQAQFTITPGIIPVVTAGSTLVASAGQEFQYQVAASNLPISYGASGLPPGLEIDPSSGLISGTPTANGQFSVTVDAGNAVGIGTGVLYITVTISIDSWRLLHFRTTANTGDSADLADPDHDGLANLIEFAFGLTPTEADSLQLPQPQLTDGKLVLSFSPPAGISGVTYGAEWSSTLSLADWKVVPDIGSNGVHTFSVPTASHPKMFLRLTVTSP